MTTSVYLPLFASILAIFVVKSSCAPNTSANPSAEEIASAAVISAQSAKDEILKLAQQAIDTLKSLDAKVHASCEDESKAFLETDRFWPKLTINEKLLVKAEALKECFKALKALKAYKKARKSAEVAAHKLDKLVEAKNKLEKEVAKEKKEAEKKAKDAEHKAEGLAKEIADLLNGNTTKKSNNSNPGEQGEHLAEIGDLTPSKHQPPQPEPRRGTCWYVDYQLRHPSEAFISAPPRWYEFKVSACTTKQCVEGWRNFKEADVCFFTPKDSQHFELASIQKEYKKNLARVAQANASNSTKSTGGFLAATKSNTQSLVSFVLGAQLLLASLFVAIALFALVPGLFVIRLRAQQRKVDSEEDFLRYHAMVTA